MAHTCPTCFEICYCMGDYQEQRSRQPAYCKHCTEYNSNESDKKENDDFDIDFYIDMDSEML